MLLLIGRSETRPALEQFSVADFEEASAKYAQVRDASGEGASTFPEGKLFGHEQAYRVSYNGKVWDRPWEPDVEPVYNPYA